MAEQVRAAEAQLPLAQDRERRTLDDADASSPAPTAFNEADASAPAPHGRTSARGRSELTGAVMAEQVRAAEAQLPLAQGSERRTLAAPRLLKMFRGHAG
jgi:hypothetical protein